MNTTARIQDRFAIEIQTLAKHGSVLIDETEDDCRLSVGYGVIRVGKIGGKRDHPRVGFNWAPPIDDDPARFMGASEAVNSAARYTAMANCAFKIATEMGAAVGKA